MTTEHPPAEHRLMVMLFTDLLDWSSSKVELGDLAYAGKIARPHNEIFRRIRESLGDRDDIARLHDVRLVLDKFFRSPGKGSRRG